MRIARILCGGRTHSLPFSVGIQFAENVYWTSHNSRKKRMDGSLMFAINVKSQIRWTSKSKMQIIIFKQNIIRSKKSPSRFLQESYSLVRVMNLQNWPDTANLMESSSAWIVSKITMTMTQKRMSPSTLKIPSSKKFRRSLISLTQEIKTKLNSFKNSSRSSSIKKRPTKTISKLSSKSFSNSQKATKTLC